MAGRANAIAAAEARGIPPPRGRTRASAAAIAPRSASFGPARTAEDLGRSLVGCVKRTRCCRGRGFGAFHAPYGAQARPGPLPRPASAAGSAPGEGTTAGAGDGADEPA